MSDIQLCIQSCWFTTGGTPQELIYLVVMIGHMSDDFIKKRNHYQVLDFFSGAGRISKLANRLGFRTAAVDKEKERSCSFDMNTSAGFVLPGGES